MLSKIVIGFAALSLAFGLSASAAFSQNSGIKEKPPMYSYVANWAIPRAQWAEMDKANAESAKILDKAIADGTLVGYGDDENLVHTVEGETHDGFWSAMSIAGLLKTLDQFYSGGDVSTPVLESATKHWDEVLEARYFNWKPGTY